MRGGGRNRVHDINQYTYSGGAGEEEQKEEQQEEEEQRKMEGLRYHERPSDGSKEISSPQTCFACLLGWWGGA